MANDERDRPAIAQGGILKGIDSSPRVAAQRLVNSQIQQSPVTSAQRKGLEAIVNGAGPAAQRVEEGGIQKKSAGYATGAGAAVPGAAMSGESGARNPVPAVAVGGIVQRLGVAGTHARLVDNNFVPAGLIPLAGNVAPPNINRTTANTTIYDAGVARAPIAEGATMTAYPISNRTRNGGSPTDASVRDVSRAATGFFGRRYIAGHLLNSHLGGSGAAQNNITAFTAKSNSQHHAGIEKELKQDVAAGFIAHYVVDCSTRQNVAPLPGVNAVSGLASTLVASYGLLRAGGDASAAGDYDPLRLLTLNLDPGGAGQATSKDGDAMADDFLLDHFSPLFVSDDSDDEFADLIDAVAGMSLPDAANHILHNLAGITDLADRATIQNRLTQYLQTLA